ncbi:MAG: IS200/IS605 family transposase [Candidatus Dojkabacteria bacterium]
MKTRVQSHVAYQLLYHIVWIPKYRKKVLVPGVSSYLDKVIRTYLQDRYPDVVVEEMNVQVDHVHILLVVPPKYSVSKVVGDIKSNSSRLLRKKFEYLRRGSSSLWSVGYYVSSVGLDEQRIRKYVRYQENQDKGQLIKL